MRIVVLSDTHGSHDMVDIPCGDVLIFAGDCCATGCLNDLFKFNKWLGSLPHEHILMIAGNHDVCLERDPYAFTFITNARYLKNEEITINGIKFYGSPYTPMFNNWSFMLSHDELKKNWDKIPSDVDVLITHGPPYGINDKTIRNEHAGCMELCDKIKEIKPKYHAFGHIHEGYGIFKDKNTTYVNASIVDFHYQSTNKPIVFEI